MNIISIPTNISGNLFCQFLNTCSIKYTWISFSFNFNEKEEFASVDAKINYAKNNLKFKQQISVIKSCYNNYNTYYIVDEASENLLPKIAKINNLKVFL